LIADPHLTLADLADLGQRAAAAPRRRLHRNLHASAAEPCQRLINAMLPDSYIRPHRHADYVTNECLLALRGRFLLIQFDEAGAIVAALRLGGPNADVVVAEVAPASWHTVVALEDGCVLFETKSGPYDADAAKTFAPWAPAEGAGDAPAYLARLRDEGLALAARTVG
jgi:cupin fold WbuC family metalloprotein